MAIKNKKPQPINIVNRKAEHEYFFTQTLEVGIVLAGTEVRSIRSGNANLKEAFCFMFKDEVWIKNMHISLYKSGGYNNHNPTSVRKLLLNKREIKKLFRLTREKGVTLVPYRLYENERNIFKIELAVAKGKKKYDKRQSIKNKDSKRSLDRIKKMNR